jgi:hypothetical protein
MRVVEQASGRPVAGAKVFLVSKPNGSMPEAAYNLTTDQYGFIFAALAYSFVYIKSYLHWKREE